jgi:hypothetical protein
MVLTTLAPTGNTAGRNLDMKTTTDERTDTTQKRREWVRPALTSVGTVSAVLRGGTEKNTVTGDPGEPRGNRGA